MSSTPHEITPIKLSEDGLGARRSPLRDTTIRILHSRSAVVGLVMIVIMLIVAVGADFIATHDPIKPMFGVAGEVAPLPRKGPCVPWSGCTEPMHLMGLDQNARDVFSRVIYGSRLSLFVGVTVVAFSLSIGVMIGLIAGYAGGWIEDVLMRAMDVLLAFPSLLLSIAIVTIVGPGLQNALLAIGIVSIPVYARLTRASVISVKEMEYVTAGRALGAGAFRLMFINILPNVLTPLIVQATLGVGTAVIEAAALSFLGLGAQPPDPEWGQMLSEARSLVFSAPHLVFFPGIAITFTVLGFNLLGDGLRDALDPRMRGTH